MFPREHVLGSSPLPAQHQLFAEQFVMLLKLEIRSLSHLVPARDRDKLLKRESASFMPGMYLIARLSTCRQEQRELAVTVCNSCSCTNKPLVLPPAVTEWNQAPRTQPPWGKLAEH